VHPDQALERLIDGNARFAAGAAEGPNRDPDHRRSLVAGQEPWAMVVSCADSRVPPELLFDVGLGELFVVRVAGNLAMPAVLGSVELAVAELGCRLLVVLGHEGCGAVQAAMAGPEVHDGAVRELANRVAESFGEVEPAAADPVAERVYANVRRQVALFQSSSPSLSAKVAAGELRIVGAVYGLASGHVTVLPEDPAL
jgi:carbonic anhydrase